MFLFFLSSIISPADKPIKSRTIDDYFQLIMGYAPKVVHQEGEITNFKVLETKKVSKTKDHMWFAGYQDGHGELAVLRINPKLTIILSLAVGCGPVCTYDLKVLQDNNQEKTLKDVTSAALPTKDVRAKYEKLVPASSREYRPLAWSLPANGSQVLVAQIEESDDQNIGKDIRKEFMKLEWDEKKEKFVER